MCRSGAYVFGVGPCVCAPFVDVGRWVCGLGRPVVRVLAGLGVVVCGRACCFIVGPIGTCACEAVWCLLVCLSFGGCERSWFTCARHCVHEHALHIGEPAISTPDFGKFTLVNFSLSFLA